MAFSPHGRGSVGPNRRHHLVAMSEDGEPIRVLVSGRGRACERGGGSGRGRRCATHLRAAANQPGGAVAGRSLRWRTASRGFRANFGEYLIVDEASPVEPGRSHANPPPPTGAVGGGSCRTQLS